jgi:hypothetical protein
MIFTCFVVDVLEDRKAKKLSPDFTQFIKLIKEKIKTDEWLDPLSYNSTFIKNEKEKSYIELFPLIKKLQEEEQEIAYIMYHRNIEESFSKTSHSIPGFKIPSVEHTVNLLSKFTQLPKIEVEIILQLKDRIFDTPSHLVSDDNYNEYGNPNTDYDDEPVSDYEYFADRYDYHDDE